MENKLISMVDFVLKQSNNENLEKHLCNENGHQFMNYWHSVFSYAKFIKQPLKLGMFVPCDENDVPLDIPFNYDAYLMSMLKEDFNYNEIDCMQYKQAKDRVLFEGFVYEKNGYVFNVNSPFECRFDEESLENGIIEDIVKYDLTLTASAIKQFEL